MITAGDRQRIVAEAKTWLGTPWHHRSRIKNVGVDCAMLIREVFITCNLVPAFSVWNYAEQWALHHSDEQFLQTLRMYGQETVEKLPGNVIVFKYGRCYSHGGIIVDWPMIIHAFKPSRQVVYADMSCSGLKNRPQLIYEVGI